MGVVGELRAFDRRAFDIACLKAGLSRQADLAAQLGVSRGVVADIVRGVIPRLERRSRIAELLGVEEWSLWPSFVVGNNVAQQ